jgi:hypothetical protein
MSDVGQVKQALAIDQTFGTGPTGVRIGSGATIYSGAGVPAVTIDNLPGDIYIRTDGGAGTTFYQFRSGAWVATT